MNKNYIKKSYQCVEHFDILNHILSILLLQCSKTEIQKFRNDTNT